MGKKEILILDSISIGHKYVVHLVFKDYEELQAVADALKPLGYTFRFPKR